MELQLSLLFFVEAVGTIAFASSGAMVAIKKQLDLLGVIVLGVTTAVGGGMLRDIIIGNVPPNLFKDPVYVLLAFITVMILFVIVRRNQKILASRSIEMYEKVMNIFDAVGLGAFTVVGIDTAVLAGYGRYHFLIIFRCDHRGGRRTLKRHHGRRDALYTEETRLRLRFHHRSGSLRVSSGLHEQ